MKVTTFEDHLEKYRGKPGTEKRADFDSKSFSFRLGVMLSEARKQANLTRDELAKKTGTRTSYISKIETGKSDIQLSTFIKLVELGLGKKTRYSCRIEKTTKPKIFPYTQNSLAKNLRFPYF